MDWAERLVRRAEAFPAASFDRLLAVGFALLAMISIYTQTIEPANNAPGWTGLVVAVAAAVPVALRRRHTISALIVSLLITGVYFGLGYPEGSLPVNNLVLTYTAAAWQPPRQAVIGLGLAVGAVSLITLADQPGYEVVPTLVFFVGAWLGGSAVRWRGESLEAALRAAKEREEIGVQRSGRLLAEERLRIAQELHDVVAHSMSVIAVQAGAGSHLLDSDPGQARAALDAISQTSRSTLSEMRRLLGVLRGEDGLPSHTPAPGVTDLPALVEEVRSAGVPVSLHANNRPGDPATQAIDLTVFRIVQEALTNVIKHAGHPTFVDVDLDYRPADLHISVTDDGRGAAVEADIDSAGHGLIGMRERVELWGGRIHTGPRAGGGFVVDVCLPYGEYE